MNKEEKYPHLEEWCKEYYEKTNLKVHASNVPVNVLLDELLGRSCDYMHKFLMIIKTLETVTERLEDLDVKIYKTNQDLLESVRLTIKHLETKEDKKEKVNE